MEGNITKYIVSKLNALGVCDEELDDNTLENSLEVSRECQKGLDQIFQTAAKSGNFPVCKSMLLKNMGNPNPADEDKVTAFHYAAENGHWEICCLIIKYLKHKNPGDVRGLTPLHLAAQNGHLKICQLILGNVADKNPKAFLGWTPLHFAAQKGQLEACKLFLENIAEKNPANMCGQTPKSLAIENGHAEIGDLIDDAMKEFQWTSIQRSDAAIGWALAHPEFGSSIDPITTKGTDYAHHITASPPRFENTAASLQRIRLFG